MNNNLKSFTMADRRSSRFHISNIERIAFTMAEILLSLTIIGVVAAITLPSLTGNINEKTWNTQRKALYARMSQAIALMGSLNGYGLSADNNQTISNAAKIFVTNGLSKNLKINNICDYEHFQDCGITSKIVTAGGSKINLPTAFHEMHRGGMHILALRSTNIYNTKIAAFETANKESLVVYYNPLCKIDDFDYTDAHTYNGDEGNTIQYLCVNFVFDLNGKKGPNTVGKDIGTISAFYPMNSYVVAPEPNPKLLGSTTYDNAVDMCKNFEEGYRLPTIQEWMGMYANEVIYGFYNAANDTSRHWAITQFDSTMAWTMYNSFGIRRATRKINNFMVRCVKR